MKKAKEYQVSDLFYSSWKDLDDITHARGYALQQQALALGFDDKKYGFALIAILRLLRKNKSLVDRIDEPQALDIYNDLKFLNTPWYYFPDLDHDLLRIKPDPELARTSFDQFIYADNEFTGFLAAQEGHLSYLCRLAVTLYKPKYETVFDKESVDERHVQIKNIEPELLQLVWFTFAHIREKVMKRCKTLLPASAKSEGIEQKSQRTGAMWYNIKHQAARTLVFGDFDNVGRTNMYSVLDHLEMLCKEKEENRGKRD